MNLQNTTNRTNININLNMQSKDVFSQINQSKKAKNQIKVYNIQKTSNSIYNIFPSEYTNLNRPYQRMSFSQNQSLDLIFHIKI